MELEKAWAWMAGHSAGACAHSDRQAFLSAVTKQWAGNPETGGGVPWAHCGASSRVPVCLFHIVL